MGSIMIVLGLVPIDAIAASLGGKKTWCQSSAAVIATGNVNITGVPGKEKASQNCVIRKRKLSTAVDANINRIPYKPKALQNHVLRSATSRGLSVDELQLATSCVFQNTTLLHGRPLFQRWTVKPTVSGSVSCEKPGRQEIIIDEMDTQSYWLAHVNSTVIVRDASFRERSRLRIDSSYPLGTTSSLFVNGASDQNDKRSIAIHTTTAKSLRDAFSDLQPEAAVRLDIERAVDQCKVALGRDYTGVSRAIGKLNIVLAGLSKLSGLARWQRMNSIVRTIGQPSVLATWLDCHRFLCGQTSSSSQNTSVEAEAARRHCNFLRFHSKEDIHHGFSWFRFHLASMEWEPTWARGGLIMHIFMPCTSADCQDGGPHDHPWTFVSKVVRGGMEMNVHGFDELTNQTTLLEKWVPVQAPQSYLFPAHWEHSVKLMNSQPIVTVMLTDPKLPLVASRNYFCGQDECSDAKSDVPLVDTPNYSLKLQAISAYLLGESDVLTLN